MAKERKMICTCGGWMKPAQLKWLGVALSGRRCVKCGEETISATQSLLLDKKLSLAKALRRKRKILQVGNAIGITIPEELKNIGFRVGRRVRTELVGEKSLKVTVE